MSEYLYAYDFGTTVITNPPSNPSQVADWSNLTGADRLAPSGGTTATQSGTWSDPSIWDNGVPEDGANATIAAGATVQYDVTANPPLLDSVRVEGVLDLLDGWQMHVGRGLFLVTMTGLLKGGAPGARIGGRCLFGETGVDMDLVRDEDLLGTGLMSMGRLELFGHLRAPLFKTRDTVPSAATSHTFSDTTVPDDWQVGDRIVLDAKRFTARNSDDLDPRYETGWGSYTSASSRNGAGSFWDGDEAEEVVITAISPDRTTLSWDTPLVFEKGMPDDPAGGLIPWGSWKVSNLDRGIAFESAEPETRHRRGYIMSMNSDYELSGVMIREMGRTDKMLEHLDVTVDSVTANVNGRYPFHCHRGKGYPDEEGGTPQYGILDSVTVAHSPGWGLVNHDSVSAMTDCVVWRVQGAGIIGESGPEIYWCHGCHSVGHRGSMLSSKELYVPGTNGDGYWWTGRNGMMSHCSANAVEQALHYPTRTAKVHPFEQGTPAGDAAYLEHYAVKGALLTPEIYTKAFSRVPVTVVNIQGVENFEASACYTLMEVHKASSEQFHDIRSVFRGVHGWNNHEGIDWQYVGRYSLIDAQFHSGKNNAVGDALWQYHHDLTGIVIGKNSLDVTLVRPEMIDAEYGLEVWPHAESTFALHHRNATGEDIDEAFGMRTVVEPTFRGNDDDYREFLTGARDPIDYANAAPVLTTHTEAEVSAGIANAGSLLVTQNAIPTVTTSFAKIELNATKRDELGEITFLYPSVTGAHRDLIGVSGNPLGIGIVEPYIDNHKAEYMMRRYGYWQVNGQNAVVWGEWSSSRYTGHRNRFRMVAYLEAGYNLGSYTDNGPLDLAATDLVRDDVVLPTITITERDRFSLEALSQTLPAGMEVDGLTWPKHGVAHGGIWQRGLVYAPPPRWIGTDEIELNLIDRATMTFQRAVQPIEVVAA